MKPAILFVATLTAFAADVRKIWDGAPHNAFTDLIHHEGRWLCVFREGRAHVSTDGSIRVLASEDGRGWRSIAHLTAEKLDLRDPKLSVTPDRRLMMTAAGAHRERDNQSPVPHDSLVWFSKDGANWSEPTKIGDPNFWLWRATWYNGAALMPGYETGSRNGILRLYQTTGGRNFRTIVPVLLDAQFPNEATVRFRRDGSATMLVRRDGGTRTALFGTSQPPYTSWDWRDLGVRVGGPNFIQLLDGRLIGVVRLHDGAVRTAIVEIDPKAPAIRELEKLPSSGDSSYAGIAEHKGELWISYYSSHEGKAAIYLARWKL